MELVLYFLLISCVCAENDPKYLNDNLPLHDPDDTNTGSFYQRQEKDLTRLEGLGEVSPADFELREESYTSENEDPDEDIALRGVEEEELLEYSLREEINDLPVSTSERAINFNSIKSQLRTALQSNDIPDEITDAIAALESAVNILKCIPTVKEGNCYTSNKYCDVNTKSFIVEIKLTVCKSPWSLRIDFKIPSDLKSKLTSWARRLAFIDVSPVVLTLDHRKDDGITKIVHNARIATAGLKILFIKLKLAKVYFNFELKVRWDCTRPKNDNVKRLGYNTEYDDGKPENDMNKLYYKLKIGYQVKTKRFPCFCYKCKKCETILHKQGHFAEGPDSCKSDWSAWSSCSKKGWLFRKKRPRTRTRTCVGQSTGGPPCPGSSTGRC